MGRKKGSKELIRDYLRANLGKVIKARDIQAAAGGASEWARRIRELRNEEGWQILSHKDRRELKPGDYLLETETLQPAFKREVSKELRARVLERNGNTCQMCGAAAGDPDPFNAGRTLRLTLGHIKDKSKGGTDTMGNLRATCTNCNEGLQNASLPKPDRVQLLSQIRRATLDDQEEVLRWLLEKFKLSAHPRA